MKLLKRILSLLICVSLLLGVYVTPAMADSNDRISAFINLAAGKSLTDDMAGNMTFTKDQLRFMGIYCSNFFVPFGTELGVAGTTSETSEESVDEMAQAIMSGLKMSEIYAKTFAENILNIARSSATPLKVAYSTGNEPVADPEPLSDLAPNYYNFLKAMLGGGKSLVENCSSAEAKNATFLYWGTDAGGFTPMASAKVDINNGYTAFQFAFLKCLESVNITRGYGFSIFDLFESEAEDGPALTGEEAMKLSILGQTMMVDSFGDIIAKGLQHQFIVVPGAVNPYTWCAVDAGGGDIANPGDVYQLINAQSMSAMDSGNLFQGTSDSGLNTSVSAGGGVQQQGETWGTKKEYNIATKSKHCASFSKNLYSAIAKRMQNANKEDRNYETNKDVILKKYAEYIKILLAQGTGGESFDVSYEFNDSDRTVVYKASGKYESWAKYDAKKFKTSAIKGNAKAVEAMNAFVRMQNHSELYDKVDKKVLKRTDTYNDGSKFCTRLKDIREEVNKKDLKNGAQQNTTSAGDSSVIIKQGDVPVVNGLLDMLTSLMSSYGGMITDRGNEFNLLHAYNVQDTGKDACKVDAYVSKAFDNYGETMNEAIKKFKSDFPNDGNATDAYEEGDHYVKMITDKSNTGQYLNPSAPGIPMSDCMVFIDNLQQYNFGDGEGDVEWSTLPVCNYLDSNSVTERAGGTENTFAAGYSDIKEGKLAQVDLPETMRVGLYTSYLFAGMYEDDANSRSITIGKLGYRIAGEKLPSISNEKIDISAEAKSDFMLTSIRDWLYYLLHPSDGFNYFRELITNKLNAFLVGIHNDMNGTFGTGITTGTSAYRNNYGYVTSPDLSEIEWTDSLLTFYNNVIPFLMVAMLVTMVMTYVVGILSLQKSIFGFIIFAVFLFLPVNLINGVVGSSNRISTKLYGDKFTYWALVQQETYSSKIQEAANGESYQNYLRTLYEANNQVYSNQGTESIMLKWQAPKKMASLMLSSIDAEKVAGLKKVGQDMLRDMFDVSYSGETYLNGSDNLYLYRSYLDISNFSQYIYKGLREGVQPYRSALNNDVMANWNSGLQDSVRNIDSTYREDREKGYTNSDANGSNEASYPLRLKPAISSYIVGDALNKRNTVKTLDSTNFVGLNQGYFNFSIPMFSRGGDFIQALAEDNAIPGNDVFKQEVQKYAQEDFSSLAAYSLQSENVFYYFSWLLYDMGITTSADSTSGFKNLILGQDNAGFFYNRKGNGELKDFMDMKTLFTYIIPYMRQCNDLVKEWDEVYGVFTYDGVTSEEGHLEDPNIQDNPELKQKYWHNLNVARLYGMYCPWVDVMYDCSYAKSEKVHVQGDTHVIEDPLDPASYPENRPMVFSKSEMLDYGLSKGDLTKVEKLIIECEEDMQERMFELLNYHNFNDVTLNTGAAMTCAFVFNETFSENGLFSNNHNIYPQTFELGDFSYDAFLRFILSNTTGESMSTNQDFYSTIVEKSSTITAIMLIVLDIMSIYIMPAFKIFFIIGIFVLSILMILVTAFKVDSQQKFVNKMIGGLVKPMLAFLAINVGFSYIISLFMGTGNSAVTQTKSLSISMGDPVTVMITMCAVNIGALILYWKVLSWVIELLKREGKLAGGFLSGVVGSVGGAIAGAMGMSKLRNAISGGSSGGGGGGSGNVSDDTSASSPRASRRAKNGSNGVESHEDRIESTRQNDAKRRTIKDTGNNKDKEDDTSKLKNIENITHNGMDKIKNSFKKSKKGDKGE